METYGQPTTGRDFLFDTLLSDWLVTESSNAIRATTLQFVFAYVNQMRYRFCGWCRRKESNLYDLTSSPASPSVVDYPPGGFMNILAVLRQAEAKLEKQASVAQQQLDAVRAAMKILGRDVARGGKRIGRKKRVMSAAARARISKATKARWVRFRAEKKKGKL